MRILIEHRTVKPPLESPSASMLKSAKIKKGFELWDLII